MLRIIVDDRDVRNALDRLKRATNDMKPAFTDLGEYYLRRIDSQFRDERDPYNNPWHPLSAKTLKRKRKERRIERILQSTGLFRSSFSYTADKSSVEIGSNRVTRNGIPLGVLHQLGSRRLPKREILPSEQRGLPQADREEILSIIGDHIEGAW